MSHPLKLVKILKIIYCKEQISIYQKSLKICTSRYIQHPTLIHVASYQFHFKRKYDINQFNCALEHFHFDGLLLREEYIQFEKLLEFNWKVETEREQLQNDELLGEN